jgi:cell division protein FtsL
MVTERISLPLDEALAVVPAPRRAPGAVRRAVPVILTLLAGVMGAALAHVWVRMQHIQTGYALSRERREAHQLAEEQKRLRLEAAVLKHPGRIERIARLRLGMVPPEPTQVHVIRTPRRARAAAPAAPAAAPAPVAVARGATEAVP